MFQRWGISQCRKIVYPPFGRSAQRLNIAFPHLTRRKAVIRQQVRGLRGRAPDRKCSPPFRGGLRPPHSETKEGEKTFGGPCQAPLSRGSGILFFIIHHEICKPLICIGADLMMNDKK